MEIRSGIDGLASLPPGLALSVGNFDGLHRGHRNILHLCRKLPSTGVAIVTFEPHPLTVLRPDLAPPRLSTIETKRKLLADGGADFLVELPPAPEVLNLSAEAFWEILRDKTRPSHLVEGDTFNFGKDRRGTIDRLREWCKQSKIELHVINPVEGVLLDLSIVPISSSIIRFLIAYGRVRDASICLGRPYALVGPVIKGHQRGRAIGFPTANIHCPDQLVPADGVYAGRCTLDGKTYPAAVSIGTMPTFGKNELQVEAYLVGFNGDLYGRTIEVEVIDWIREQVKFDGLEALKQQLKLDVDMCVRRASKILHTEIAETTLKS